LSGCVDVHLQYKIESDGSGTLTWNIEILPQGATLGLTPDKLRTELVRRDRSFQSADVEFREARSPSGNQVLIAVAPFKKVAETSSPGLRASFSKLSNPSKDLFQIAGTGDPLQTSMIRIRADVEMPGRIVRSNADRVEGNMAYFDSLQRGRPLYVESEPSFFDIFSGRSLRTMAVGIFGMLLVLAVYWRFDRRRLAVTAAEDALWTVRPSCSLTSHPPPPKIPKEEFAFDGSGYCPQCGEPLDSGARFCGHCGSALT
jgi:hypothetical protein